MNSALAIIICALTALICRRFNFPTIPIYILLGLISGSLGFVVDETSEFLGKLGVVLLLFYIGLEIEPNALVQRGREIAVSGVLDLVVNFSLLFVALYAFGVDLFECLIVALALYISSSAISLKLLIDNRKLIFPFAETVVWIMIFEDLVLVVLLALLSAKSGLFVAKILTVLAIAYALYRLSYHFRSVFRREDEVPILVTFALPASALVIAEKLKVSEGLVAIALGVAFSRFDLDKIVRPFKEVFLAFFFFIFGASITLQNVEMVLAVVLVLIAVVGKLISGYLIGWFVHNSKADGFEIFKYTIARGEFSIILASLYGLEFSGLITVVVLITSVVGTLIPKIRL